MPPLGQLPLPPLLPKPPGASRRGPSPPPRRKKRSHVIAACLNCRQHKTKCSGERPICRPCQNTNAECCYDAAEGVTSRQASKRRTLEIKKSHEDFQGVISLLRSGSEADAAAALTRIREAENVDEAVNVVAVAQALLTASSSTAQAPRTTRNMSPTPARPRITSPLQHPEHIFEKHYRYARDQHVEDEIFVDLPALCLDLSRWTSACNDNRLMNHILLMFWTWDNIVERVCCRPLFEEDVSAGDPHSDDNSHHPFCSPFLVNAMLALGCLFCMDSATFTVPDDPSSRGRRFSEEAEKYHEKEKLRPSIQLLQGQYAIFCYEGCLGSGLKSVYYYHRSMETYKGLNKPEFLRNLSEGKSEARRKREEEALSWVLWGMYVSEWRPSQAMGFQKLIPKPFIGKLWRNSDFSLSSPSSSGHWWFPYPHSFQVQKSMIVEIREVETQMSAIVEDILNFIYPLPDDDADPPTSNPERAVELYNALVRWNLSLPPRLRIEDAVMPDAILIHCHLEIIFTAILRPFSHFTKTQFGPFVPKERCHAHAVGLANAIWTFRAYGILRYEYWLCHATSTAAFITLREEEYSPAQIETLVKACTCLLEMGETLPLAIDCLAAIHSAFKKSKLHLPSFMTRFFGPSVKHRKDGLMHHAVAALLPEDESLARNMQEMRLQELLDDQDNVALD